MSILLIGERSRNINRLRPLNHYPLNSQQTNIPKRQQQEQYRRQLLIQMREDQQRKRIAKQKEKQMDEKYEKQFYQLLSEYRRRDQEEIPKSHDKLNMISSSNLLLDDSFNHFSRANNNKSSLRKKHERTTTLPSLDQRSNHFKANRYQTQPTYDFQRPDKCRLQTQPSHYNYHNQLRSLRHLGLSESTQQRQRKLNNELQNKLNEVYSLMQQSSKICNNPQQLDMLSSQLHPIRLHFQKGYKVRHPQYYEPYHNYPEGQASQRSPNNYFKLPNITRSFAQNQYINQEQSEKDWREWYASQKMKQLESKYKRELELDKSDIRLKKIDEIHRYRTTPYNQFSN